VHSVVHFGNEQNINSPKPTLQDRVYSTEYRPCSKERDKHTDRFHSYAQA